MQKTSAVTALIAMGFLGVALCSCATQLPVSPDSNVLNDQYPPKGQLCMVDGQGCMAMMAEPPRTCLIGSGHCNATGSIQMIDANMGVIPEPQIQLRGPISIDPK